MKGETTRVRMDQEGRRAGKEHRRGECSLGAATALFLEALGLLVLGPESAQC